MSRAVSALSKGMLVLGGLLILGGLSWGIWVRVNAPPPPAITDQGAIVLAVTAPAPTATPTSSPQSTLPPATAAPEAASPPTRPSVPKGPTPALLPDWTVTPSWPTQTPADSSPTPLLAEPTATVTPVTGTRRPPTRIVAPAIGLDATVVPMGWDLVKRNGAMVSEWAVPSGAAGWHITSAVPGERGNVVLSGHHNIEGKVFRYVVDLQPGDEVTLYVEDMPYPYWVTEKYILQEAGMPLEVRRRNAQWIMPTQDERLTLVTCWPYEWPGNTHRVIVVARPGDPTLQLPGAR